MPQPRSAGIILFRQPHGVLEVLLVRPGGPYWRNKDIGAWMIPKGGIEGGESAAEAALREFEEELGTPLEAVPFRLCTIQQSGGKIVETFAAEAEFDCAALKSNEFEVEWPPRSGQMARYPEVEEAQWMTMPQARERMLPSQLPILDALEVKLSAP